MRLSNTFFTTAALLAVSAESAKPRDAILLSQVESLTLRGGAQTSHRRVPAAPQLKCISHPSICAKFTIDLMRCENKGTGYDSEDIQWSCHAQLPPELKLGSTDVICEGYSGPDDPYVLKGSCGVEYRMALTREGEERWPDLGSGSDGDHEWYGDGGRGFAVLFWIVFFAVAGWIIHSAYRNRNANNRDQQGGHRGNNNNFWGGGGGGGGDDGWDDPPPPYPGTNNGPRRNNKPSSAPRTNNNSRQAASGWQNNVLSGAAGAAAGYYFGSRGRNNNNNGGYEGGGMGGRNYGSTWSSGGAGSSRSGSSSSGSAASSSRYESTGFGSTSRR